MSPITFMVAREKTDSFIKKLLNPKGLHLSPLESLEMPSSGNSKGLQGPMLHCLGTQLRLSHFPFDINWFVSLSVRNPYSRGPITLIISLLGTPRDLYGTEGSLSFPKREH